MDWAKTTARSDDREAFKFWGFGESHTRGLTACNYTPALSLIRTPCIAYGNISSCWNAVKFGSWLRYSFPCWRQPSKYRSTSRVNRCSFYSTGGVTRAELNKIDGGLPDYEYFVSNMEAHSWWVWYLGRHVIMLITATQTTTQTVIRVRGSDELEQWWWW